MEVIEGGSERAPLAAAAVVVALLLALTVAVLTGARVEVAAPLVALVAVSLAAYRAILQWVVLVAAVVVVILFVPIRIYKLPGALPFDLEPYRLVVALVLVAWVASLLVDPRVRLRRTPFDRPLGLIVAAALASVVVNPGHVSFLTSYVVKSLTFFLSFVLLYYLITSVIRSEAHMGALIRVLVLGGAVLGAAAMVERRTGYNAFHHLSGVIPGLRLEGDPGAEVRAGRLRVMGSAQHPIALGAAFAMILPLAVYMMKTSGRRYVWWTAGCLLFLGTLATASRTAIVMLVVGAAVFFWLRPAETRRLVPVLVPMLVVVHLALPGAIGTIRGAFFPQGGLLAEQSTVVVGNQELANGRLADLGPSLREWTQRPLLGQGFGTRVTGFGESFINAPILDNQWLGVLLETGAFGTLAWLSLFLVSGKELSRLAKSDETSRGWLAVALTASIAAFAVGMFTYDAFSFIQATFIFWILLALGACLLALQRAPLGRRDRAAA